MCLSSTTQKYSSCLITFFTRSALQYVRYIQGKFPLSDESDWPHAMPNTNFRTWTWILLWGNCDLAETQAFQCRWFFVTMDWWGANLFLDLDHWPCGRTDKNREYWTGAASSEAIKIKIYLMRSGLCTVWEILWFPWVINGECYTVARNIQPCLVPSTIFIRCWAPGPIYK